MVRDLEKLEKFYNFSKSFSKHINSVKCVQKELEHWVSGGEGTPIIEFKVFTSSTFNMLDSSQCELGDDLDKIPDYIVFLMRGLRLCLMWSSAVAGSRVSSLQDRVILTPTSLISKLSPVSSPNSLFLMLSSL